MKLILTEKPDIARSFSSALGCNFTNGYYKNNEYIVTNAIGHLIELYEPHDYNEVLKRWSLEFLPIVPQEFKYKVKEDGYIKKQFNIIKKAFSENSISEVIVATDAGREGELIGRLVLDSIKENNIDFSNYRFKRFWTSNSLTDENILEELNFLKDLSKYDDLYTEAKLRGQIDWLYGINYSRLFSLLFRGSTVSAYGRVQSCVLNAIYLRDKEIREFAKNYFYINKFNIENYVFSYKDKIQDNFDDYTTEEKKALALKIKSDIDTLSSTNITEIIKREKKAEPPSLYNLTDLQKDANKFFGYSAKKTTEVAQSLYETHKILSYPRTSSRHLNEEDFEFFNKTLSTLELNIQGLTTENKKIFDSSKVEDHYALLVLDKKEKYNLNQEETNIYDLVYLRIKQAIADPYVYHQFISNIKLNDYVFTNKTNVEVEKGWKKYIYKEDSKTEEEVEEEKNEFTLEENTSYSILDNRIEEKETKPKSQYSESTLLSFMEKWELGTSATRAGIVETLFRSNRGYCERKGKNILITDIGIDFIEKISTNERMLNNLAKENTNEFEKKLKTIDPGVFRKEFVEEFKDIKDFYMNSNTSFAREQSTRESLGSCPVCSKNIYEGQKNYYCESNSRDNPCFSVFKSFFKYKVKEEDIKKFISGEQTEKRKLFSDRTKNYFDASLSFDAENKKIKFIFE